MTWKEITDVVETKLKVPQKKARQFVGEFRKRYTGHKEAIESFDAAFTDSGRIEFTYKINNKPRQITI